MVQEDRVEDAETVLRRLEDRADDLQELQIAVANHTEFSGPDGKSRIHEGGCCVLQTQNGDPILLHRDALEVLLNDGFFNRRKIPISLVPIVAR